MFFPPRQVSKARRTPEDPALGVLLMEEICQRENLIGWDLLCWQNREQQQLVDHWGWWPMVG